jgi:carbonic anhydrase/acetyltransferase-like protein (isoleucine patch superfamily)
MGAIVMDGAVVHDHCIVAAGAVVTENTQCQPGWIYAGIPAKPIKPLTQTQITQLQTTAKNYIMYAEWLK